MARIGIDFETRSEVDLPKHGAENYFDGKEADIVFLSYKVDDGPIGQWFPGDALPDFVQYPNDHTFYAFNAIFEYRAWNYLGYAHYNFGLIGLDQMIDVMAICGRFSLPQSLAQAGEVLNLRVQKDKRGKQLIKKICCPPYHYTQQDMSDFIEYGRDDVQTMYEMVQALPASKLAHREQDIWEMTQRINLRGIPVDVEAAKQIYKLTEMYKEEQSKRLPDLTDGNVTKPTQAQRIKRWINRQGCNIPNLTAETVKNTLLRTDLPDRVRQVLELRQELGKSSTAKYKKIIDMACDNRIYDNLRYYAAGPGRWGGMGVQVHNLPRSKVKDAQPIIDMFMDLSVLEDPVSPVQHAKDIIRGMICAPDGWMICAADFASVENRGLAWFSGDEETLQLFRQGLDQYIDMASFVYGVPYTEVTDAQRQFGKLLVLGCGYGLGAKGFQKNAATQGITLTLTEAQDAIRNYRERYIEVVKFWYACRYAAIEAISNPGVQVPVGKVYYQLVADRNKNAWLMCMLPSGRAIYYNDPMIGEGEYGLEVSAMGINSYTKKWQRLRIIPGRFVENIVQGFCRDLLAQGKLNLEDAGFELILSVHDEAVSLVPEGFMDLDLYCKLMCDMPAWADGLPLAADGMIEKRYRKM